MAPLNDGSFLCHSRLVGLFREAMRQARGGDFRCACGWRARWL